MIKFRILNYVVLLIGSACILFSFILAIVLYDQYFNRDLSSKVLLPQLLLLINVLLLAIGLSFIKQACGMFLRHGYFNTKSAWYLTIGGYILAASALSSLVPNLMHTADVTKERASNFAIEVIYDVTVLLVGFALLAVADIVKKGAALKLENDLTI